MRISSVAVVLAAFIAMLGGPALAEPVRGAGSTFAFPLITQWSQSYQVERAGGEDFVLQDSGIDYEPVGSLGGILRLAQPEIDFAATDAPLPPEELAKFNYVQFPIVMGGIVPVLNIDGVKPGELKLTGAVLADIYLGKIQNWNDAAIKASNAELTLPDLRITVVHRSDGSGSTFNWTTFLSAASEDWKTKYGADTLISWPLGADAEGNSGMAAKVKETPGAIGYLEYGQTIRASLNYAAVQNPDGHFVKPEPAAFQAAASTVDWANAKDFYVSLVNAEGKESYPITAVTFAVMRTTPPSTSRLNQALWFFDYGLGRGGADAATLGYVPLPEALVNQVKKYWTDKFKFSS
jgi:phosphate transport system substrate-binding protein